jgi:hypothetical protein
MDDKSAASASMTMLQMATGSWVSQAIYVVAKLGIADLLEKEPLECGPLAKAAGANPSALYRVMRALASLGVFAEEDDGRFHLTPLAECLRTAAPGSLRAFAIMLGEDAHWRMWGAVLHSVKTGEPAFDHVFGMSHFQYFAKHPEAARLFNDGMTSRSGQENSAIVAAYDFSGCKNVIDLGGGVGTLLAAILRTMKSPRGILFDLPHVIETARAELVHAVPAGTCSFIEGNFFEALPDGGDVYVLKKVIHDWDDQRALSILRNCRAAMPSDGRLLLIEPVIPPGNGPSFNKLLDVLILMWTSGGKERTQGELRLMLDAAGLSLTRAIPTASSLTIVEAIPKA